MTKDIDKMHKGVARKSNGSMSQEKETKDLAVDSRQDVLGVKNMNNGTPLSEQKSQKPKTHKSMDGKVTTFPTSKSNAPESAEAACLETEKHEDVKISENANDLCPPPVTGKSSKHTSPQSAKEAVQHDDKHNDEDDKNSAASSSAASGRITKSVTVGTAPTFKSAERAQKRREYYMKLEEKRKAMEAEKAEAEARSKEEQQAAIREMRKNMVFKANPVPNFYYEPPPPKVELKKLPLTRPVSPKLNRRKSCGDLVYTTDQAQQVSKHCAKHHDSLDQDHNEPPSAARANLRRTKTANSSSTRKAKSCSGFEQEEHHDASETNDGPEKVDDEQPSADVCVES